MEIREKKFFSKQKATFLHSYFVLLFGISALKQYNGQNKEIKKIEANV